MENLDIRCDKSKKSLEFLEKRIKLENYRGIHKSQHNRYNLDLILVILRNLYKIVGTEKLHIRTFDSSKRTINNEKELKYSKYVTEIQKQTGRCTQDSLRKNIFVDLNRMDLINRYSDDELIDINSQKNKRKINFVSISDKGMELINEDLNILDRQMKFTDAINTLLGGLAVNLLSILPELEYLSVEEYTFFVSFLGHKLNDHIHSEKDIIELVTDYRTLDRAAKNYVTNKIKEFADSKNFKGNKKTKRDFHNWKNEAQQIFCLLDQTAFFEYIRKEKKLIFKENKKNGVFKKGDAIKLKRSNQIKEKYFELHKVQKVFVFELHHIVHLCASKNNVEFFKLLDDWKNLLYIDGHTHSIITQKNNRHIVLNINEKNNIELTDLKDTLFLTINENVLYNQNYKNELIKRNRELIQSIK